MSGGAVTWSSKQQAIVALSTVEAEYVAMSCCAQQMVWMHSWLDEVEVKHSLPGLIKGDNRGAIALTKNTKDHGKVKHIDIQHHYIRKLIQSGAITIEQVPSEDNLADLFTKPLPHDQHHHLLTALNIKWAPHPCMGECWDIPGTGSIVTRLSAHHHYDPNLVIRLLSTVSCIYTFILLLSLHSAPLYSLLYILTISHCTTLSHSYHTQLRVSLPIPFTSYFVTHIIFVLVILLTIGLSQRSRSYHTRLRLLYPLTPSRPQWTPKDHTTHKKGPGRLQIAATTTTTMRRTDDKEDDEDRGPGMFFYSFF